MSVFDLLHEALQHLAWSAEEQLSWIEREQIAIDELALDYDNAARAAWQLVDNGQITRDQLEAVTALQGDIAELSDHEANWTRSALTASAKWVRIRRSAAAILARLAPRAEN